MVENIYIGRTLLKPCKTIMVSKRVDVPDDEANKNLAEGEVRKVKRVTRKVIANYQLATVVATGRDTFKVGEKVVFKPNRAIPFDLVKDTILVDDFDIIAPWVDDVNEVVDTVEDTVVE